LKETKEMGEKMKKEVREMVEKEIKCAFRKRQSNYDMPL